MSRENKDEGFAKIRNGINKHIKEGKLHPFDLGIYLWLHLNCNWKTGVCRQTALGIALNGFNDAGLKETIQKSLRRLRKHGYINYPKGVGKRGGYLIVIHKFEPSALRGYRINAWFYTDKVEPRLEEINGGSHGKADGEAAVEAAVDALVEEQQRHSEDTVEAPIPDVPDLQTSRPARPATLPVVVESENSPEETTDQPMESQKPETVQWSDDRWVDPKAGKFQDRKAIPYRPNRRATEEKKQPIHTPLSARRDAWTPADRLADQFFDQLGKLSKFKDDFENGLWSVPLRDLLNKGTTYEHISQCIRWALLDSAFWVEAVNKAVSKGPVKMFVDNFSKIESAREGESKAGALRKKKIAEIKNEGKAQYRQDGGAFKTGDEAVCCDCGKTGANAEGFPRCQDCLNKFGDAANA